MAKATISPVSNDMEHKAMLGMVTSTEFLAGIIPVVEVCHYQDELFRSRAVAQVFRWCRDYHAKYREAPGRVIQDIYDAESAKPRANQETMEAVGELLAKASGKFEDEGPPNPDYLLGETEKYLRERSLDLLREDVAVLRSGGQLDKAEALVSDFRRPARIATSGISVLDGAGQLREAFEHAPEPLFTLPGTAGALLNEHLVREGFVAFMGPEKRGKTFALIEMSIRALLSRRNVALFAVGDMSLNQMLRRIYIRIAGKSDKGFYCQAHQSPVMDCALNQDGTCRRDCRTCDTHLPAVISPKAWAGKTAQELLQTAPPGYLPCSACRREEDSSWIGAPWWETVEAASPLTWQDGERAAEAMKRRVKDRSLRLAAFPNNSVSVNDLERQLDLWERYESFVPDVVLVDYADILAPLDGRKDYRHQQNDTWMALRRLSQERHCLAMTATQSDADSYDAKTLGMGNYSEDKRKLSHVSAMVGLNQTRDEKRLGLYRWNLILVREGESDPHHCVTLLQDLRRGKFLLDSF